jgi:hypothetical protein
MFVTSGQFIYFLGAVTFGGIFGVLYSVITAVKSLIKNQKLCKILGGILEIIFFLFLSVSFLFYRNFYGYPSLRAYMVVGVILGLILYAKSFHLLLAKAGKVVYNRINKFILTKKVLINDGKESKKSNRSGNDRRDTVNSNLAIGNVVPVNKHQRRKERTRRIRRTNLNL